MNYRDWFDKGDRDLNLAKLSLKNDILDYSLFHAQQAAEKYLKSFLVCKNKYFKKKHDIFYLVSLCMEVDRDFEKLLELGLELFDRAIEVRYPTEYYPSERDVKEAIEIAEKVREFVLNKLEKKKSKSK